jgi:hypothetical protein
MSRRGQCRCGTILDFALGPNGYKMRCPTCGSVVRLRFDSSTPSSGPRQRKRSGALAFRAPIPADASAAPVPPRSPSQFDFNVLEPGELPVVEMVPLSELRRATRAPWLRRWWLPLTAAVIVAAVAILVVILRRG